jgi:hypothetical protein
VARCRARPALVVDVDRGVARDRRRACRALASSSSPWSCGQRHPHPRAELLDLQLGQLALGLGLGVGGLARDLLLAAGHVEPALRAQERDVRLAPPRAARG